MIELIIFSVCILILISSLILFSWAGTDKSSSKNIKNYSIYVTEEIAISAKEKGFLNNDNKLTAEQICGWLREDKNIQVFVFKKSGDDYWTYNSANVLGVYYSTYQEALFEGIKFALTLI